MIPRECRSGTLHNISAPREEYYLKEEIRHLKRQLQDLQKELKNSTWIKEGVLTDRERMVLHFSCASTIARFTGVKDFDCIMTTLIEDVRKNRCHSLSVENVVGLLKCIEEEMAAGKIMFRHLMGKTACCEDEEHDNLPGHMNNHDWRDMK